MLWASVVITWCFQIHFLRSIAVDVQVTGRAVGVIDGYNYGNQDVS